MMNLSNANSDLLFLQPLSPLATWYGECVEQHRGGGPEPSQEGHPAASQPGDRCQIRPPNCNQTRLVKQRNYKSSNSIVLY